MRSAIAIATGFLLILVLSLGADSVVRATMPGAFGPGGRTDSVTLLLMVQAYLSVFAILGCYVTARLAPDHPMRHALMLGALGLAFNIVGMIIMWATAPVWYHVMALLLVMPLAWMGGKLREMQLARARAVPAGA
ncbi:MAG TPA: hypothetical protein VFS05_09490 [Gemmatimonadaceae bacterium]|nr:hypothetical protein [Gemmatimonadaceae bacterium]